jgi:3-hydroxybutyryl-CoA dehydrogenase
MSTLSSAARTAPAPATKHSPSPSSPSPSPSSGAAAGIVATNATRSTERIRRLTEHVDALMLGMLNHAAGAVERGEATAVDLDAAMRLGAGFWDGPLRKLDEIGLDTAVEALDARHRRTGRAEHQPADLLRRMVADGLLGQRSGRGFYAYGEPADAAGEPPVRCTATPRRVRKVGVVGGGTMATGIAEVFLRAGLPVTLVARTADKAVAASIAIARSLRDRGTPGADAVRIMSRCAVATALTALGDCDLVIEAVVEDLPVKQALFAGLGRICRRGTVLATTTSSLPVTDLAIASGRPQDVVGLHFFNPAPVMQLVEVVSTERTADDARATALAVCAQAGKAPVECADRAGFLVNALMFPYLNDALRLVQEGVVVDPADLDWAVRKGCGLPTGPVQLVDVVGADVTLAILSRLHDALGRPEFEPVALLRELVSAGYLGRKSGRGVREYVRSGRATSAAVREPAHARSEQP